MKLPAARIAAFLTNPNPAVRVILVYGPDAGLARERAAQLAKLTVPDINDPFRTAALTASAIAEDPARLRDEMAAQALGGDRRLIRLLNPGESAAPALAALLADMPNADSLLLIEAGDLDRRSKLRAACEGLTPLACAIPCYVEDTAQRLRTITEILTSENIRVGRDVAAVLADILPPDRSAMRSELEKLSLYVGAGNAATIEDIHAAVQDAGAAELDDLVFAIGAGETKRAAQLIDRLYAEQTAPVAILRAAQRHFVRLQWARAEMDKGLAATEAVKRLQPPVFWKHESAMTAQLRRWSLKRTELALRRLYDAEAAVKKTGTPDAALCAQTLLGLAA
ncbi:MAG: DNA polymerase III subunit delta [Alphaproteobacteria bacterium]|nr:DNA polymerase III subunit delta [Alphaproteobacteria bacterium]